MRYPLLSRLFLSRYRHPGKPSIALAPSQVVGIAEFNRECAEGKYTFEPMPCVCGSSRSYCIALTERYGLASETHLCLGCGLIRTSPRLSDASLNTFYTRAYPRIYQYSAGQGEFSGEKRVEERVGEQKRRGEEIFRYIGAQLPKGRAPVVFDVGCSTGAGLLPFKDAGAVCYGCDLGSSMFAHGRALGLTLLEGDEQVLAPHAPADLVILSHVLEHLPHPRQTVKNLRGLLRSGGILYIELPGARLFHAQKSGMMQFLQNAHLWYFTLGTLKDLLEGEGFRLIAGDQRINAFFRKETAVSWPSSRHPIRARLMLLYVFGVEILCRTRLIVPVVALRNLARRLNRKMFRELY